MAGDKMTAAGDLRYVHADHVDGDGVCLSGLRIEDGADCKLGELTGLIVEPGARRLHYFVVDVHEGRYLMPFDNICFDPDHSALRVMADPDPGSWQEFDPDAFGEFDDDDLISALFARRAS
jgi:hypothetical protein